MLNPRENVCFMASQINGMIISPKLSNNVTVVN